MIPRSMLAHRLSQDEIKEICVLAHGKHNDHLKEQLYQLTLDDDRRVAVQMLQHKAKSENMITINFIVQDVSACVGFVILSIVKRSCL